MLRQTIKELKWRSKHVSFEEFLEMFSVWLRLNLPHCSMLHGRYDWRLAHWTWFQHWLSVQKVTGRPETRSRRRCCSKFNHLDHVGRSPVDVNEVHQEAQFVENSCFIQQRIRTGVMWSFGLMSVMRRAAAFCKRYNDLIVDSGVQPVQRCSSPVGWAPVPRPDAWWLHHQQSDIFDAVASTERRTADNTTDVLLNRQPIVEKDTKISYDFDRLMSLSTECARLTDDILHRLARLPNHCSSVLSAFSWSRRDEHLSRLSVTQQHSWWRMVSISEWTLLLRASHLVDLICPSHNSYFSII